MMHWSGTFHYAARLPAGITSGACACDVSQVDHVPAWPNDDGTRLVGPSPRVVVYDAGFNERPGPARPHVLRHGLRLEASGRRRACVRSATFHVEATLLPSLRAGDELHLVRTTGADVGLSVLRAGHLVCAVGDIASVPLGDDLSARVPLELRERIARVFLDVDPEFPDVQGMGQGVPLPLALRHDGADVLVSRIDRSVGPYDVTMLRPPAVAFSLGGAFGTIVRRGACSALGARLTTMLLAQDDALEMSPW